MCNFVVSKKFPQAERIQITEAKRPLDTNGILRRIQMFLKTRHAEMPMGGVRKWFIFFLLHMMI